MKLPEFIRIFDPRGWAMLAAGVAVLILIVFVIGRCSTADDVKRARHGEKVATTQADVGQQASDRAFQQQQREAEGAARTQANADNILGADNANDSAGEAGRRGQLAYCDRQRMRGRSLPEYCP